MLESLLTKEEEGEELTSEELLSSLTKFSVQNNITLNNDYSLVNKFVTSLLRKLEKHGKPYCPCYVLKNDSSDNDYICPCKNCVKDYIENGKCHCTLFKKEN